ncbi:MAG TPA: ATP-binding protein [Chthoniobacterales bacterium]|nr:ATP-binding protein [Chthoniobacterales bacterium]
MITTTLHGELIVRVTATGIGIAAEALPKIFHAFDQGSLATGSFGGLGLGLAITRAIRRSGPEVYGAGIGAEAPELVKTAGPFDAVISDLGLPDRNGFQPPEQIHAAEPQLPAIASERLRHG